MAEILLDVTNYLDWGVTDDLQFIPGQPAGIVGDLNVTHAPVEDGFDNVWGHPHLRFFGSREDLVRLIDRYEEDEELRPELYDDIKE